MRLTDFIRKQPDIIEREWEEFAKTFATGLSVSALRDHLREILEAIVDDIERPQSSEQEIEKSKGKAPRGGALDRIAAAHATIRLHSGIDLENAIAEYRALRGSILRLWAQSRPSLKGQDVDEVIRFNETIDQAVAEIVRRFAGNATRYSERFIGILVHDLRSPLNLINLAGYQLLEADALSEAQAHNISRIFKSVRRIDRLANDLAVLVRSRVGTPLPLTKTNTDLGDICEQALDEVKANHHGAVFEIQKKAAT